MAIRVEWRNYFLRNVVCVLAGTCANRFVMEISENVFGGNNTRRVLNGYFTSVIELSRLLYICTVKFEKGSSLLSTFSDGQTNQIFFAEKNRLK